LIARFYNQPEMVWVSRFVFIGFVVSALSSTPTAYFFRNLQVKMRISIQMTALLISGVVGVICAFMGMRYWSLAIQTVVYTSTNSLLLWIKCPWRPKFSLHFAPLMEMLPFSIKQLVVSFFTHVNNNVFQVLLGRFYGMATTGYYTQGQKWTAMGYSTLNGMLNNVGQPVFRQTIDDQQRLHRVFSRLLRFTCLVSFPAMFGLAIVSKELIVLTVTDKWLQSVPVMSILCIGGAFLPIATLYGNLFNSVGRPSVYMWNTIILGLIQVGVLCAIIPLGLYTMLKVYITINIAWLIVWQLFARRLVGIRFRKVAADIAPYLLISMAVMGMTVFVASSIADVILALLVKMAVAAALYILAIRIFLPQDFKEAINFIRHR
ncbi:MAG: oligosaccharide flippase family protein, partial [Muribaculaceae bacterium]|nr:oligosaccharide flippase family protein [Muribaculaceae bacterium]